MGGGKSRALCEAVFLDLLNCPGLKSVIFRDAHTSIVETTKKTMLEQVIPAELYSPQNGGHKRESQGEDYVRLWNGSVVHFAGMDNPYRWYSAEIGLAAFDEAQEMDETKVVRILTRLRQPGMPNRAMFTFNPSSPGHWLQRWFLSGGEQTEYGFRKDELFVGDASAPIGDCEFFFAKATDNVHLPHGYVEQTLAGLPERLRRRYLEGLWEFVEGNSFFDPDDLAHYQRLAGEARPLMAAARTTGDPAADFRARQRGRGKPDDPCRFVPGSGQWTVWRKPEPGKRYVMAVDTSSGGAYDYSAVQVVCVEDFEQVARFQGKLSPSELAVEAYRAGRVFNNATAVPEITGGWGFSVIQELQRLHYPATYTRRVFDRLARRFTDKLGWDTTRNMRAHMLDSLYRVLSERELGLFDMKTVNELATFVYGKNEKPEAQQGCNDDLVVALAIAVTVTIDRPRKVLRPRNDYRQPVFAATGYGA